MGALPDLFLSAGEGFAAVAKVSRLGTGAIHTYPASLKFRRLKVHSLWLVAALCAHFTYTRTSLTPLSLDFRVQPGEKYYSIRM